MPPLPTPTPLVDETLSSVATTAAPAPSYSEPTNIEVVATRLGFYANVRRSTDDKFKVEKFSQLGSWMVCVDRTLEKKRQEMIKAKKAGK